MRDLVVAVDVGTRSARAGLFDRMGEMVSRSEAPFAVIERGGRAEHSSEEIWRAVCRAVQAARAAAAAPPDAVAAIAFDATCSLVIRDADGAPLPVSPASAAGCDTIAWCDHRALPEADACSRTGHPALDLVGGRMSPEMQVPKLMWLKRNTSETWGRMAAARDLSDHLAWRACGTRARSLCTLATKWAFLGRERRWPQDFLSRVGLGDLPARADLPADGVPVGTDLGALSAAAATELGLDRRCRVAAGLVDAYAGALGLLPYGAAGGTDLALIAGTSTCLMGHAHEGRPIAGAWGPFHDAILPGEQVFEAGQSATGALLDRLIVMFGRSPVPPVHRRIAQHVVRRLAAEGTSYGRGIHIVPDFHGNRSPFSDPGAVGVVSGLRLDTSFDALCATYWRGCVGLALGIRQILEHLRQNGVAPRALHMTGGHTRIPPFPQLYADATGLPIHLPVTGDAVLSGTAIAAAAAAGWNRGLVPFPGTALSRIVTPDARSRYADDYRVYLELQSHRRHLDAGRHFSAERVRCDV